MLTSRFLKSAGFLLCGFIIGIVFTLIVGFDEEHHKQGRELIKPGTFGDIRILIKDLEYPDINKVLEVLTIWKGEYPFIAIPKEPTGNIPNIRIVDAMAERELIRIYFEKDRISEFSLVGNEGQPVFTVDASNKAGVWHKANYTSFVKIDKPLGRWVDYMPVGEHYEDIDFDGHFDAKMVYNEKGEIDSFYIFIKGQWQEVCHYSSDELEAMTLFVNDKFQRIKPDDSGYDSKLIEKLSSLPKSARRIRYLYHDFEWGKGWKVRKEQSQ